MADADWPARASCLSDRIVIPAQDDLPPLQDLIQKALASRSDLGGSEGERKGSAGFSAGNAERILPTAAGLRRREPGRAGGNAPDRDLRTAQWRPRILISSAAWATPWARFSGAIFRRTGIGGFIAAPI